MNIKESIKSYLQKIPAFFSGFMLGVILTGAFFLFKINDYLIQIKDTLYPKITVIEKKEDKTNIPAKSKKQQKNNSKITEDTSIVEFNETSENAAIAEEKIISEKQVQIIHLNTSSDTSFAKLADAPQYIKDSQIKIIFKKTPFNNKGYYFEDNQLVLYGLEDIPYINLYEYNNDLYIKYDKIVFKLPYVNQFHSLIRVEDEVLLAKMN